MEYNQAYIESLISDGTEESTYLEFKDARSLDDAAEMSKDISAFANAGGGTIIYGISESEHKASGTSFINGNKRDKEWLENIIDSNIKRKIEGLRIFPIRFDGKIEQTIYAVSIPESDNSPHMDNKNRFHRRANFKNILLEEYELRLLYERKSKVDIKIENLEITNKGGSVPNQRLIVYVDFNIAFQVHNISNAIETLYKLEVAIPSFLLDSITQHIEFPTYFIRNEGNYRLYSFPNKSPLFQNEKTTITNVLIRVEKGNFLTLKDHPLKLKLYYSNGTSQRNFQLDGLLTYGQHEPITFASFL